MDNQESKNLPQKKSVILLWILSIITLGIYGPVWYLKRKSEFDNLQTNKKLSTKLIKAVLILFVITLILRILLLIISLTGGTENLISGEMGLATLGIILLVSIILSFIIAGISITAFVLFIILAFKTREILNQTLENKKVTRKISGFFTFIFNFLYLQYEINRIIEDREYEKRTGPWIIFILLILLTIFSLIIQIYLSTPGIIS
ncbi:MAG TPA: DUF4234 domain-containing protein [Candidatus Nanoarchaeia archaeon]|nr:DUF4234 domain-containing protein [Candidatus Nanoarchaeia archaeon]